MTAAAPPSVVSMATQDCFWHPTRDSWLHDKRLRSPYELRYRIYSPVKLAARKVMVYIPKFQPINGIAGFDFMFLVWNEALRDNRFEHTASNTLFLTEGKGVSRNVTKRPTSFLQNGRRFRAKILQTFQFLKANGYMVGGSLNKARTHTATSLLTPTIALLQFTFLLRLRYATQFPT